LILTDTAAIVVNGRVTQAKREDSMNETGYLSDEHRSTLLSIARQSIETGLETGRPLAVDPSDFAPPLQETRATFVTLHIGDALRGCIGHLEAGQPLVSDVADNAFSAAFRDPRFTPLAALELPDLQIHISVLTPAEPISFSSEQDLVAQLQPGIDGLILEVGPARGTFLPSVWDSLPEPAQFLAQLKRKAGLSADYWSDQVRVSRYRTESFS
jgi:AmmeMemoRadiSam system protein A